MDPILRAAALVRQPPETRTVVITFRVTPAERDLIDTAVADVARERSDFLRQIMCEVARAVLAAGAEDVDHG